MRIAVVHSFYTASQPSGENNAVRDQVEQLSRSGHEVRLIARYTDDEEPSPTFKVRSAWTTATGFGRSPELELSRFKPDVVHLHNVFPNWGTRWLRRWGPRTVATLHNFRTVCSNGLLFRDGHSCTDCLETPILPAIAHACYRGSRLATAPVSLGAAPRGSLRVILTQVARIIALNPHAASLYEQLLQRPVDVVPNFVAEGPMGPPAPARWAYVGRLSSEKGVDVLLRAWPDGHDLDVIGGGPLEPFVESRSLTNSRIRKVGMLSRTEVLARLSSYAGVIVPSMCAENQPTVVLEAMARGVPTILSHHVQMAKHLVDAGVALTFRPEHGPSALLPALNELQSRSQEMQRACRDLHRQCYSFHAWQAAMDEIYEAVAASAESQG